MGFAPPSPAQARVLLVVAAVLWSLGSFFTRVLREPTGLGLDDPQLTPLQIAFFRNCFAGLVLVPALRLRHLRVRPTMLAMVLCFGVMSGLYLSALGLGQAANAILLQNSAPFWVYLLGVYLLGEAADRRNLSAILLGLCGTIVIVCGNWPRGAGEGTDALVLMMGVGSGATYAGVVLFLRHLRAESSVWLSVMNLVGSAGIIGIFVLLRYGPSETWAWVAAPSPAQIACLVVFGAVQMAIPYWLFTSGLRSVSPQEAGIITLLEPILNPVWAYLIAPDKEVPTVWTWVGGLLLLGALGWRYVPRKTRVAGVLDQPPADDSSPRIMA
ncbi:DMT family transporter [Fimbriiglobus ruber]|uniref:Membrane protein n=1 Tax=Fimbriiglobus ruber TaxID=1908690 RepID=A0A225EFX5_9BACT|nr:DMT family transporter [Fimbriiglobus ruber]OWK47245.1 Membrane protein [Fimbriiglobus ruber]